MHAHLLPALGLLLTLLSPTPAWGGILPLAAQPGGQAEDALRIFLRTGPKTHGEGQHDHPRFGAEWQPLLEARGATVEGAERFPTTEELDRTDVLVLYAAEGATIEGEERARFEAFLARGGGLVVLHDAVCGDDPFWFRDVAGGAWEHGHSKWLEGEVGLQFSGDHPITAGAANFDFVDEIYYDLHLAESAEVLATSFHSVFSITPQMWVVDDGPYRAFVSLQGHEHASFSHPAWRTLLLRGIAWAGGREVDLLTTPEEVEGLRYPPGGPLTPEVAHEPHVLHEDFTLELVAAEPLVVNPISIDWDAAGRMWVALTPSYPFKQEFGGAARDSIVILGDEDGDGRMDRAHTFCDGLDLVTSFVFHADGVIAAAAPDIWVLRDTDGDDVADQREVLFTGFGTSDTHAVVSNLRWGLDGWIYATQGYSGNASRDVRNAEGTSFGHIPNGLFRFRPDGSAIEPVSVYGSNTWGLDFDASGELFFTMANGSHLRHVVTSEDALGPDRLPGTRSWNDIVDHREVQRLSRSDREPYVQIDFVGGFTAASGCLIYSGGAWPSEFAGNHFVCEPTVNLIHRDLVRRDGISFAATKPRPAEFLASTDPWFRPVHLRTGPDGALYVLDFYNQAIVHNDTRGPEHGPTNAAVRPDRDDRHGRIWRVQHENALAQGDTVPLGPGALAHANRWQRMTAQRELVASGAVPSEDEIEALWELGPVARIHALWSLEALGSLSPELLAVALVDADPGVRRAATRIATVAEPPTVSSRVAATLRTRIFDVDLRVRLAALEALRALERHGVQVVDADTARALVGAYPDLADDWTRSALLRTAETAPERFLAEALRVAEDDALAGFLYELCLRLGRTAEDVEATLELLALVEEAPEAVTVAALDGLRRSLPAELELPASAANSAALTQLLTGRGDAVAIATLPFAARVTPADELGPAVEAFGERLLRTVENPDAELAARETALAALLAIPAWRTRAVVAAARFLDPFFPRDTQLAVVRELGRSEDEAAAGVLAEAYARVSNDVREAAFRELVTRPTWTARLLDEVAAERLSPTDLGPQRRHRLVNHPDRAVAERAALLLERRDRGEMDVLLESLLPIVNEPGDVANGEALFRQNCAQCHDLDRLERADGSGEPGGAVGPALTGMGAHGREHLLPFLVDPNRSVEPGYLEYVAETVDGKLHAGVLTKDGVESLVLAGPDATVELRRDEIELLWSTGRSPMPTGFEDLGAEALRDLLAFLCAGYEDFRVLDLGPLCTSTTDALYDGDRDSKPMRFTRTGVVDVDGVPMEVLSPGRSQSGNNALVLKGGAVADWDSKQRMPRSVDVPVGFALQRMHVLGGIAAWGHPYFGKGEDILAWTWHYADGTTEEVVLRDGDQFADWIRRHDVPGSRYVEGLLAEDSWGQLRSFHLDPERTDIAVTHVTLASFDNQMAPTVLGLTAQLSGVEPEPEEPEPALTEPKVLILGGGSSHDFARWFDQELLATLGGLAQFDEEEIEYTDRPEDLVPRLETLEVLVLANNQPIADPILRSAIFAHVEGGGGLVLLHAATWFNWADWPEYNAWLVGGGASSHENYDTFDVHLYGTDSELTQGVPASFAIEDELYRFEPGGSAELRVFASGTSRRSGSSYPVLWTTTTESGRVVCLTLGHDRAAHEHPAFRMLVRNAVAWAAGD